MKRVCFPFLFFLFIFFSLSFAENQNQTQPTKRVYTILDFKDELKLSKEQVEKIRKIIDEFEKRARPLREKIVAQDREIRELLEREADLKEIKGKVKENFSLRADLLIMDIEAGRKIDGVLTPEQLKKWREIRRQGGKR